MNTSKYVWAGVLTQSYTEESKGKMVTVLHPVTFLIHWVTRAFSKNQIH